MKKVYLVRSLVATREIEAHFLEHTTTNHSFIKFLQEYGKAYVLDVY